MEELITLNQLKIYDAEKTNHLNVQFNNVYNYIDNSINNVALDITNLGNTVNDIHNELNETHNNFTTLNFSATNATVTDLNVVNTVSINGVVGNNGQVLGVVNGKSEWMDIPDPIDADNFYVNNIYVNNIAKVNELDVTTYTVMAEDDYNNMSMSSRGESTFYLTQPNGNLYFKGYGYSPFYIPEAYYSVWVNLSQAGWLTSSRNHILFLNTMSVSNNFPSGSGIYGVQNRGLWENSASIGVNARYNNGNTTRGIATNAKELYVYDASSMYSLSYTVGVDIVDSFIINPSLVVNAPSDYDPMKYCVNMYRTFYNQHGAQFTGTSPVYIGNNVIDMTETFMNCINFNQPVTISDSVTEMTGTFHKCKNLNSPVTIGNSVVNMVNAFRDCSNFDQPIAIPSSVVNMEYAFNMCVNFNQPIVIPDSVTNMYSAFSNCQRFNSPVTIGNNVTSMAYAFENTAFNRPIVIPDSVTNIAGLLYFRGGIYAGPFKSSISIGNGVVDMHDMLAGQFHFNESSAAQIHISRSIVLGDRTNYIYNCLVNGATGASIRPSQIYNDL